LPCPTITVVLLLKLGKSCKPPRGATAFVESQVEHADDGVRLADARP
jgi:hypothetical protein